MSSIISTIWADATRGHPRSWSQKAVLSTRYLGSLNNLSPYTCNSMGKPVSDTVTTSQIRLSLSTLVSNVIARKWTSCTSGLLLPFLDIGLIRSLRKVPATCAHPNDELRKGLRTTVETIRSVLTMAQLYFGCGKRRSSIPVQASSKNPKH